MTLGTAESLESLKDFQLIFCHPEAVVENKPVLKSFKRPSFGVAFELLSWMRHILSLTGKLKCVTSSVTFYI